MFDRISADEHAADRPAPSPEITRELSHPEVAGALARRTTRCARVVDCPNVGKGGTLMEWPSTLAESDALIVREDTPDGLRFVVHSHREPQFMCPTYAEAEARTLAYATHARVHAWYADGRGGLQLLAASLPPVPSATRRRIAPAAGRLST